MSQRGYYNWFNEGLAKETAMPITKPMTRDSSATVPEYASQQLFYLNAIHLLILPVKCFHSYTSIGL